VHELTGDRLVEHRLGLVAVEDLEDRRAARMAATTPRARPPMRPAAR
jgi:hypothetical protein